MEVLKYCIIFAFVACVFGRPIPKEIDDVDDAVLTELLNRGTVPVTDREMVDEIRYGAGEPNTKGKNCNVQDSKNFSLFFKIEIQKGICQV